MRWRPLGRNEELPEGKTCIVTRRLNTPDGKPFLNVTIAFPGWNYSNNKVLAYMPVKLVTEDRTGWLSEYWGDEPPKVGGWHLGCLQSIGSSSQYFEMRDLCFDVSRQRWFPVPLGREVIAYRPYPKPYSGA
jgi:hypothetical protein